MQVSRATKVSPQPTSYYLVYCLLIGYGSISQWLHKLNILGFTQNTISDDELYKILKQDISFRYPQMFCISLINSFLFRSVNPIVLVMVGWSTNELEACGPHAKNMWWGRLKPLKELNVFLWVWHNRIWRLGWRAICGGFPTPSNYIIIADLDILL